MLKELHTLNPEQLQAVKTVNGRVLILAGAGSGKTRVLTFRMAYLIDQLGVDPGSILGLTFTNKAAQEMRERITALISPDKAKKITLCTFHSFCMQILRKEIQHLGYTPQFSLYDEGDIKRLVTSIAKDLLEHEGPIPSLTSVINLLATANNEGLKGLSGFESSWHEQFVKDIYTRLKECLRAYNAVDFDSLMTLTVDLFERFPEVLQKYQDQYTYLMIDEYQDTNAIQYRLADLLSKKNNHLCVVGDDDQSIYGWRGANIKNILEFDRATVIKLEQNYRSTNTILEAANQVISHNSDRHKKKLWSSCGQGEPIEVFHAPQESLEAEAVVNRLAHYREKWGLQWKDFAILYRSNALARQFELALMKHTWKKGEKWVIGIPYQVFGGTEFYERREVKDLFAYLRLIANPQDQEALLRVINQPRRGIGDQALDALTAYNRKEKVSLWSVLENPKDIIDNARTLAAIQSFVGLIKRAQEHFRQNSLAASIHWLIEEINYKKAIADEVKSPKMREFKWENVQEFASSLHEFESQGGKDLHEFITSIPLENEWAVKANAKKQRDDAVNLMTFHSSKGLEFPVCFLVGMEDHIMPHEKSVSERGLAEERRLMYVAITRAQRHLVLSMAKQRKKMGKDFNCRPSRFLFEIPKNLLRPVPWDGRTLNKPLEA
jgi:ATP-dependent DNA helicase UvrD/PcrA